MKSKYADEITLVAPEHFTVDIATEFRHTQAWAAANIVVMSLCHPAMFLCAFVTYIIIKML